MCTNIWFLAVIVWQTHINVQCNKTNAPYLAQLFDHKTKLLNFVQINSGQCERFHERTHTHTRARSETERLDWNALTDGVHRLSKREEVTKAIYCCAVLLLLCMNAVDKGDCSFFFSRSLRFWAMHWQWFGDGERAPPQRIQWISHHFAIGLFFFAVALSILSIQ